MPSTGRAKPSAVKPSDAPTVKPKPIVFIHSSFRTGSTWLWSRFRDNAGLCAYYEIFNEFLSELTFDSLNHAHDRWDSHHPASAPYFVEFAPLMTSSKGISGFEPRMAFELFFPHNSDNGLKLTAKEELYIETLIESARLAGRIPVITCTRSLARATALKQRFEGLHIVLRRPLLAQWFSYSDQFLAGNPYFVQTVWETIAHGKDPIAEALRAFAAANGICSTRTIEPDDNLLICFLCLHIYLEYRGIEMADLVLDLDKIDRQRANAESKIEEYSGYRVDLSGSRQALSAPALLINDIERVVHLSLSLLQKGGQDAPIGGKLGKLLAYAHEALARFKGDYERFCCYAGTLHKRWRRDHDKLKHAEASLAGLVDLQDRVAIADCAQEKLIADLDLTRQRLALATAEKSILEQEVAAAYSRVDRLDEALRVMSDVTPGQPSFATRWDRMLKQLK